MARKKSNGRRDNRTGSIYKDGNGYRVQILLRYDPATGEPVYKKERAKTHDDAVDALAKLQQSSRTQYVAAPSGLTLGAFLTQWLEMHVKPSKAPKTYERYRWAITHHISPVLGKMLVDHVTRPDVQTLVAALARTKLMPKSKPDAKSNPKPAYPGKPGPAPKPRPEKPEKPAKTLSRVSVQSALAVLHTAYESAIRDGLATTNPVAYISLPAASKKPAQFLTPAQVVELNKNLEGSPVRDVVRFMLATGARLGEATGIRWEDVDIEKRFIRIAGQLQRLEKQLVYRATTKTNQDRMLTMSPWLAEQFRAMKAQQLVDKHTDPDGIAFLNPFGRRFDPKYVYNELAAACTAANIPPVSPHKLRHTAATLALMETGDLHGVQKMLGHQRVALTSDLYGHATAERLRPITDALGKLVNPNLQVKKRPQSQSVQ